METSFARSVAHGEHDLADVAVLLKNLIRVSVL